MAAEGSRIDFMFLGPPPYPAAGSATASVQMYMNIINRQEK